MPLILFSSQLFGGGFENQLAVRGEKGLKEYLPKVFADIVADLRPEKADIFSSLDGIQFLPVDKNVYLRIQSFLNYCENALDAIRFSAFMYKEYLVWSGLEQEDMRTIYRWLVLSYPIFLTSPSTDLTKILINRTSRQVPSSKTEGAHLFPFECEEKHSHSTSF